MKVSIEVENQVLRAAGQRGLDSSILLNKLIECGLFVLEYEDAEDYGVYIHYEDGGLDPVTVMYGVG